MNPIAEIDINRLIGNFNYIDSYIGDSKILAVVKADAYGHGSVKIAKTLQNIGAFGLCVAMIEELIELRKVGISIPILHLGILNKDKIDLYQTENNICTINSINDIYMVRDFLKGTNKKIYCYLKIDTGMGRLGIPYKKADSIIQLIKNINNIKLFGIYSHFSSADEEDDSFMKLQLKRFKEIINRADDLMPEYRNYHISNSGGILKNSSIFLNLVRTGIGLYGINNTNIEHDIKPIMKLKAPVVFIKNINRGDSVGYNRRFTASEDTKVGYLQIGYADGYPLEMINSKTVSYKEKLLNVIGKVSMDLTSVNFTGFDVKVGDYVTLFGDNSNKLEKVCSNTINSPYSILTGIGNRVLRKYIND